jgi:integrase
MLATGLRLQEASSLLIVEVCGNPTGGPWRFDLGAATAKGSKSRRVTIPSRVRRELVAYLQVERASAVAAGRRGGVYAESGWIRVLAAGPSGLRLCEGRARRLSLHEVGPADRARVLLVDGDGAPLEPLGLWLSESGRPVSAAAWERVFDRANDRSGACGDPTTAHPHTLRHTFAVISSVKVSTPCASQSWTSRRVRGSRLERQRRKEGKGTGPNETSSD